MATLLRLSDIEIIRSDKRVMKNVDFTLKSGEIVIIHGNNGSGKSTLLQCIYGLIKPFSGEVTVLSTDISSLKINRLGELRSRIGYIDQTISVMPGLSVKQNIASALKVSGYKDKNEIAARTETVMSLTGLGPKADSVAARLSAGEQQMLMIARAIAPCPELILADMPMNNLDSNGVTFINNLFNQLATEGAGIILTSLQPDIDGLNNARALQCTKQGLSAAN